MKFIVSMLCLLVTAPIVCGSYCYPSYSYAKPYSYAPYYQYYPQYVAYPVATYVGIPIPVFGSVYVGPNGATNVTTTATRTQTATSVQTAATSATAAVGVAGGGTTTVSAVDSSREILSTLKTLTGLVGQVAQKQEAHASRLSTLEGRLTLMESRIGGTVGLPPPPATPKKPEKVEEPKKEEEAPLPAAMTIYKSRCYLCHQEGKETLVKNKTTKEPLVLFTKSGDRGELIVNAMKGIDQAQAFLSHVTDGTMPPATMVNGKRKYKELTPAEQTSLILDLKNWKRKP